MDKLQEVRRVTTDGAKHRNESYEEERRRIAEKRRIRRQRARRRKMIKAGILLAICVACIALCISTLSGGRDTKVQTPSTPEPAEAPAYSEQTSNESEQEEKEPVNKATTNDYSSISFSKKENYDRYDAYKAANPYMDLDTVVWHVNAYLDKPKYQYDVATGGYDDPYIIVNKYYTVPDGYRPPDLQSFDGQLLRKDTGEAYKKMRDDAKALGYSIRVVSGYRTVEYQRNLYNRYLSSDSQANVDRYSARAGHSEHHTGMAMDLFGSVDGLRNFVNTPEYKWVRDNCYKYGFIIRYTEATEFVTGYEDEPWHLRYVGVEVSTDMKEKGITSFEEYHVKYLE